MSASSAVQKKATSGTQPGTDELREELETLRDDLKSLVATTQDVLKAKSNAGAERGKDAVDDAAATVGEFRDVAQDGVRQNPLMALGIAVGVGAILGALRTK